MLSSVLGCILLLSCSTLTKSAGSDADVDIEVLTNQLQDLASKFYTGLSLKDVITNASKVASTLQKFNTYTSAYASGISHLINPQESLNDLTQRLKNQFLILTLFYEKLKYSNDVTVDREMPLSVIWSALYEAVKKVIRLSRVILGQVDMNDVNFSDTVDEEMNKGRPRRFCLINNSTIGRC